MDILLLTMVISLKKINYTTVFLHTHTPARVHSLYALTYSEYSPFTSSTQTCLHRVKTAAAVTDAGLLSTLSPSQWTRFHMHQVQQVQHDEQECFSISSPPPLVPEEARS